MRQSRNSDLRCLIKEENLFLWEVAEHMQIHENTLYRMLRQKLSDAQKEKILNVIKELKSDKAFLERR